LKISVKEERAQKVEERRVVSIRDDGAGSSKERNV
jgi:hypothetical protein